MREIRFRVWDKTYGRFQRVDDVYYIDKRGEFETLSFADERGLRPILMQYTGLKDSEGEGIYEGDIVTYEHNNSTGWHKLKQIVTWNEKAAAFEVPTHGIFTREIHVIGNIYENPELVK